MTWVIDLQISGYELKVGKSVVSEGARRKKMVFESIISLLSQPTLSPSGSEISQLSSSLQNQPTTIPLVTDHFASNEGGGESLLCLKKVKVRWTNKNLSLIGKAIPYRLKITVGQCRCSQNSIIVQMLRYLYRTSV